MSYFKHASFNCTKVFISIAFSILTDHLVCIDNTSLHITSNYTIQDSGVITPLPFVCESCWLLRATGPLKFA